MEPVALRVRRRAATSEPREVFTMRCRAHRRGVIGELPIVGRSDYLAAIDASEIHPHVAPLSRETYTRSVVSNE